MASMLYGFCLGVGLFTRVTVATFYVAILVVLTLRTPVEAAIAMSVFGIGRALPLLFLERHKPDRRLAIVLSWWTPFVRMANGMILAHCGIALLTSALGFG
jgi:cytochrome c biogenesis protein CcdA